MGLLFRYGVALVFGYASMVCQASVWPTFSAPTQAFLLANQLLDVESCSSGKAKLIDGVRVKIQSLCKTYCPETWEWIAESDGQCHALDEFALQKYEIFYVDDSDGVTLGSVVNAWNGGGKFVFTSPKGEHWYCVETKSSSGNVSCANDV